MSEISKGPDSGEQFKEQYTDPWHLMTPEQKKIAPAIRETLSAKFAEYGATAEDFQVVPVETAFGNQEFIMLYAAPNGLDIGNPEKAYDKERSYDEVMSDRNEKIFNVEIAGQEVDTRDVMTGAVYEDFIAAQKLRGVDPLPDSEALAQQQNRPQTTTWLTGTAKEEKVALTAVPVGIVDEDGNPRTGYMRRHHAGHERLVRPGVVIPRPRFNNWLIQDPKWFR